MAHVLATQVKYMYPRIEGTMLQAGLTEMSCMLIDGQQRMSTLHWSCFGYFCVHHPGSFKAIKN